MNFRGFIKGFFIAISYHSLKNVIDRYPQPFRKIVIFLLRLCVFLMVFLGLFSFFTSRIYSITGDIAVPNILSNILVSISFLISLVIGFLLTAVIEEIYRKISEIKMVAEQNIENVKEKAAVPSKVIKGSVRSSKNAIKKTGRVFIQSTNKVYDTSLKATNYVINMGASLLNKLFFKKKNKLDKSR